MPGLMHVNLGGYHVRDIEFTAAFDVVDTKVGKDLSRSDLRLSQQYLSSSATCPSWACQVSRGMTHDGLGKYLSQILKKAPGPTADIVKILKDTNTDVVINYLPVGSEMATKWYVEQILDAGCGLVNCIPVFIASSGLLERRASCSSGLPIIGDDIKSQVGATILHRMLTTLFVDRGVRLDRTYQLNFGGNTDFINMLERERLESKKISKTGAVTSMLPYDLEQRQHPCRPQRLRALAGGPQVLLRSAWKAPPSANVPLQPGGSSWKCGIRPTPPAWSSTPCAAPSWPWIAASAGPLDGARVLFHEDASQAVQGRGGA